MYINPGMIKGFASFAAAFARGIGMAAEQKKRQQQQAAELARMAGAPDQGMILDESGQPCTPCEAEKRRLQAEAARRAAARRMGR
jgi:hypothetical protein